MENVSIIFTDNKNQQTVFVCEFPGSLDLILAELKSILNANSEYNSCRFKFAESFYTLEKSPVK